MTDQSINQPNAAQSLERSKSIDQFERKEKKKKKRRNGHTRMKKEGDGEF